MSHQDKKSLSQIVVNSETLKLVISWILKPALFSGMQVRSGSKWQPRLLAATALFWACSDYQCLTDRFAHARKVAKKAFWWYNDPGDSYQGFIGVLRKWHTRLTVAIVAELRLRMRQELADQYLVGGYFVCAVDGSRVEVPRTESNQQAYSAKKKQERKKVKAKKSKKRGTPKEKSIPRRKAKKQSAESIEKKAATTQIWLTLLWHVESVYPGLGKAVHPIPASASTCRKCSMNCRIRL